MSHTIITQQQQQPDPQNPSVKGRISFSSSSKKEDGGNHEIDLNSVRQSFDSSQPLLTLRAATGIHTEASNYNPNLSSSQKTIEGKTSPYSCCSKETSQQHQQTLKYTCCACFLVGNIMTELERENKFVWMEKSLFCADCAVGWKGCSNCFTSCCLVSLGWPISPCFSCYLLHERWKLSLLYPRDARLVPVPSICSCLSCYYGLCWAKNLQEQYQFIHQLKKEGNLTFAWDYALYRDHLQRRRTNNRNPSTIEPYPSHSILIFGPNTNLKHQFLRKLLLQTKNQELLQFHQQFPLFQEMAQIQTGTRTIVNENDPHSPVHFLELWDIPPNQFYSSFVSFKIAENSNATNIPHNINPQQQPKQPPSPSLHQPSQPSQQLPPSPHHHPVESDEVITEEKDHSNIFLSMFIFDLHDYQNFHEMKAIFHYYAELVRKPRMILILKDHPLAVALDSSSNRNQQPPQQHSIYHTNASSTENLFEGNNKSGLMNVDKVALEAEILTWAKRQGVFWYHVPVFDEYSYSVLNKQIMKLLPPTKL